MARRKPKYYNLSWPAEAEARRIIKNQYGPDSKNPLTYHNVRHTRRVVTWAGWIAKAMVMPERWRELLAIAASFHDVEQESHRNEAKSADQAIAWVQSQEEAAIFTNFELNLIRDTILITEASWSDEYGTVVQPRLDAASYPVERALALADLASAGMDPLEFVADSHKLLAERDVEWLHALTESVQSINNQELLLDRYREWMAIQPAFARGRQARFELELGNLPEESKRRLRLLFGHFAGSIALADQLAADQGSFDEVVERMRHYIYYDFHHWW